MGKDKQLEPVYLNVYDFTTLNGCLRVLGCPGYHSGIEIKNLEFNYCVVDSNPKVTGVMAIQPETAQYRFNRKLYLGMTNVTESELDEIIDELSIKYTCGKYHMFKFNCNHFCDQLCRRLLGQGIPRWLFNTTDCLKHICCCLPHGFVSGLWAIQSIEADLMRQQQGLLSPNPRQSL